MLHLGLRWGGILVAVAMAPGLGCSRDRRASGSASPDASPGATAPRAFRPELERADWTARVNQAALAVFADLDGDGAAELVTVDDEYLRVYQPGGQPLAARAVSGGAQVLEAHDVDGDGKAELLLGLGETVAHRGAKTQVLLLRLVGRELSLESIAMPDSERAEVVALLALPRKHPWSHSALGAERQATLLVAHFESRFVVRLSTASRGENEWQLMPRASVRMATSIVLGDTDGDGTPEVIVGRVYGDAPNTDGDAFVLGADGSRIPIPTTRGVRGLAVVDLDGDGRDDVLLGDGWHSNYGKLARAQLTVARRGTDGFRSETVARFDGQFTLWQLLAADLNGDGAPEVVVRGSGHVELLSPALGWQAARVASEARSVVLAPVKPGEPRPWLVLAARSEQVTLRVAQGPRR